MHTYAGVRVERGCHNQPATVDGTDWTGPGLTYTSWKVFQRERSAADDGLTTYVALCRGGNVDHSFASIHLLDSIHISIALLESAAYLHGFT